SGPPVALPPTAPSTTAGCFRLPVRLVMQIPAIDAKSSAPAAYSAHAILRPAPVHSAQSRPRAPRAGYGPGGACVAGTGHPRRAPVVPAPTRERGARTGRPARSCAVRRPWSVLRQCREVRLRVVVPAERLLGVQPAVL